MPKKLFALALAALLVLTVLTACAPDYSQSAVIGSYTDRETGSYALTLRPDGTGTVTHTSVLGIITEEEIVFELDGSYIDVLGKKESGGVIGRNEYSGVLTGEGDVSFALTSRQTGVLLGTFVKE